MCSFNTRHNTPITQVTATQHTTQKMKANMTDKELTCYRIAREIITRSLANKRQQTRKENFKLSSTASCALVRLYFSKQARDESDIKGREFTWLVLFSPLVFALSLLLLVLIPFNYYEHMKTKRAELKAIDAIMDKLTASDVPAYQPDGQTIESLWRVWLGHIIKVKDLESDELIELLTEWVRVQYGDKTAQGLDIPTAYQSITHNGGDSFRNLGTATRPEFLHINYAHPNESLLRYVSDRLPRYRVE